MMEPIELTLGSTIKVPGGALFVLTEVEYKLNEAPKAIFKSPVELMEIRKWRNDE